MNLFDPTAKIVRPKRGLIRCPQFALLERAFPAFQALNPTLARKIILPNPYSVLRKGLTDDAQSGPFCLLVCSGLRRCNVLAAQRDTEIRLSDL